MKRLFAYALCLGFLTVVFGSVPVLAYRVDPGCPNSEKMMANPDHSGWKNPMCFLEVAAYVKSLKDKGPAKCQEHGEAMQQMFEKNRQKIRDLRVANNPEWDTWFTVRSELLQTCRMADPNYAYVWNAKKRDYVKVPRTRDEVIQKKVEHQTAMAKIMEVLPGWPRPKVWDDTSKANKRVVNLQGLLDLMIQKVQAGADLTPFIELIVNEGKPNKQDPHYVSDDVINTAFLLYAYSVPANRADKILKYTNTKYAPRVRFAAASAVAEFAQNNKTRNGLVSNEPSGRLALTDKQREQVLDVFGVVFDNAKTDLTRAVVQYRLKRVYGDVNWMANNERPVTQRRNQAAIGPITLVLTPSLAQMLAAEASAYASSIGASIASGTTALQAALAAPATALTGEVFIGAVPVVIFGMALDDAFAPTYRAAFEHKLREALGVGAIPVIEGTEGMVAQAVNIKDLVSSWAEADDFATVRTERAQFNQCVYTGRSTPSPLPKRMIKDFVLYADGDTKVKFDYCDDHWDNWCAKDLMELQEVWNQRNSFMAQLPGNITVRPPQIFVRAVYRWPEKGPRTMDNGQWIPSVELAVNGSGKIDQMFAFVLSLFVDETTWTRLNEYDFVKNMRKPYMPSKKFPARNFLRDTKIRNGVHSKDMLKYDFEAQKPHFHVERECNYTPGTGTMQVCSMSRGTVSGTKKYICNLSIQYSPSAAGDEFTYN